ncbi:hypothetical protein [Chryseobacterium indologenes]|nr:hypothetical protein [Chryseobacterium indologenes]
MELKNHEVILGTLENIVNNAGAIKSFLPGIVSEGLNSAFNGLIS